MNAIALIDKYYKDAPDLKTILLKHSRKVADRSLRIAAAHPELNLDISFLEEAAMLHDIGIIRTDAPGILCMGDAPYICHGYLGAEMLRAEGYPRHARVCERHTGTGLSRKEIVEQAVPIPVGDYCPETWEEQVICYADKFYSKSRPGEEKVPEQVLKSLSRFGEDCVCRFQYWMEIFEENIAR